MTPPLSPEAIASMVADAEDHLCESCAWLGGQYGPGAVEDREQNANGGKPWHECNACHGSGVSSPLVLHVRALAAEVNRVAHRLDKAREERDAAEDERDKLRAELKAMTKERDKLRADLARANHRIEAYDRGMTKEVYDVVHSEDDTQERE